MAAAKKTTVVLKNTAVILRDGDQVSLAPGKQEVSADELKILKAAGLLVEAEAEAEAGAGAGEGDQQ